MSVTTERLKQPTVGATVQPVYIGGTATDGSDAPIQISTGKVANLNAGTTVGGVVIDGANSPMVKTALNATGSAPIYACRAWVNFDGTGTVAIRASGNVSSIADNGTGDYTVNFITAMPDANYACNVTASRDNAGSGFVGSLFGGTGRSTTQARVASFWSGSASTLDAIDVHVTIFR